MIVQTAQSLDQVLDSSKQNPNKLYALNFWASWVDSCVHMNKVFSALASVNPSASFWDVDAEAIADLALQFRIEAVPTFVLLKNGKEVKRIEGAMPEELATAVTEFQTDKSADFNKRLAALINQHQFMIFIKGTPQAPRCGFTRQLLDLLAAHKIQYDFFDILNDEEVRQGLKEYSDWPTYPQIYVKGELMGGLDIFQELIASNQIDQLLR